MTEKLLQFIWRFQYFNRSGLVTVGGENVEIVRQGQLNSNQGPDFTDARIRLNKMLLAGTVELHLRTSGWEKHQHDLDENYRNVVLHVVWENDLPAGHLPVLELRDRVPKILLSRYEELMSADSFIPCENVIALASPLTWAAWKERLLAERLLRRAAKITELLQQSQFHWEEVFWWLLSRNFGMKVNADGFESVARSIPLQVLARHKHQIQQLECLLMGQAGLLEGNFQEDYPRLLHREYVYLRSKLRLQPPPVHLYFLRMRPGNFPTIRFAQLAMLIHHSVHLFSRIRDAGSLRDVRGWFGVAASDYWHYHYRFDETSPCRIKRPGKDFIDNLVINTICPVLYAYGCYHSDERAKAKALEWLAATTAEGNSVVAGFLSRSVAVENACDSQALLELKRSYCDNRRCLDCAIGNSILRPMG